MNVYEYLNQAKRLDAIVDECIERETELMALATRTTQAGDGMPHGSSDPDKMTNNVQKLISARKRTSEAVDNYVKVKQDILKHLEMLPTKQKEVLEWLYIKKRDSRKPGQKWYYTWSEVADGMGCTEQNISKLRRKAIRNLKKMLDLEQNAEKSIEFSAEM